MTTYLRPLSVLAISLTVFGCSGSSGTDNNSKGGNKSATELLRTLSVNDNCSPYAINDNSEVLVGCWDSDSTSFLAYQSDGEAIPLGESTAGAAPTFGGFGNDRTVALTIYNSSNITEQSLNFSTQQAAFLRDGTVTVFPDSNYGYPAISPSGRYFTISSGVFDGEESPFIYDGTERIELAPATDGANPYGASAVNDSGVAVGSVSLSVPGHEYQSYQSFRADQSDFDLIMSDQRPEVASTSPTYINNNGEIALIMDSVETYTIPGYDPITLPQAATWSEEEGITRIESQTPGFGSVPLEINDNSIVYGVYFQPTSNTNYFLYSKKAGFVDFGSFLAQKTGLTNPSIIDINNENEVIFSASGTEGASSQSLSTAARTKRSLRMRASQKSDLIAEDPIEDSQAQEPQKIVYGVLKLGDEF